jgi:hypothetical protein
MTELNTLAHKLDPTRQTVILALRFREGYSRRLFAIDLGGLV